MLELVGLEKSFGNTHAVRSLNLTIQNGEFFSLLGPSGCGKTTLLRMLGGFETPTGGEIRQDGVRLDTLPANQRQINTVFQRYALFPHLNVEDNVAFGLRMKKLPSAEIKTRVADALALVQMENLSRRSIGTLSGGQQQRVALARALINRPKILLLDEPLSALDLKLRQQMQVELLALQRRLKHTFIFVTHDQEEALTLSDRIAVMNGGRIEQVGTPREIYENPRTAFVAKFIGSINTIEGEVRDSGGESVSINASGRRPIVVRPVTQPVATGTPVRVLVRPEKLSVLKSQPAPDRNSLEGTIKEILYQGPVTHFHVQLPDWNLAPITVSLPNGSIRSTRNLQPGEKVFVVWAPEDALLLSHDGVALG